MVSLLRYLLILTALACTASAQSPSRFYQDDPIWTMPKPVPVGDVKERDIDALFDFFFQSFRPKPVGGKPSGGINTLGEVPDSEWFVNRHARRRMTREQLQRGPGNENRPEAPFYVVKGKTEGITPGFEMRDAQGRRYFVKIDPISNPEMASAADVIGSKFFYALGYNTPENYILDVSRNQLSVSEEATVEVAGKKRQMTGKDFDLILDNVPRRKDGSYRLLASLAVKGKPVGPFKYEGTRADDPNDIVPHEDRRDLRGLYVFCAWLNHTDSKAGNTLDVIVDENGVRFIRHYLIDFGAILGSDSDMPKNARFGHEYIFPEGGDAVKAIASLGLYSPAWERADYPDIKAVGRFEADVFDPLKWRSNYPNPAFLSRSAEDEYWAAKQVLAFTDDDIRAIVETGQFQDPRAADYITKTLIERRNKIGRAFLSKVLPLDNFRVTGAELVFDDLGAKHGFTSTPRLEFRWSEFNNQTSAHTALPNATSSRVPEVQRNDESVFLAAQIKASGAPGTVTAYLRRTAASWEVVGITRGE